MEMMLPEASEFDKVVVYPSEIEEEKVRKLLAVMKELEIPIFYEYY